MKKAVAVILAAVSALLMFSSCGINLDFNAVAIKYKEVEGGMTVSGYTDKTTVTAITIPDEIDGKPVVSVSDFGVCNAESLTEITIGKNVSEIGTWAFTNNQHLKKFNVDPENENFVSVDGILFTKDMKTLCFYPCGRNINFDKYGQPEKDDNGENIITTYEIPDGVKVIRSKAFYKCYYVNITSFPDSIERIEEKAFHRTSALTNFKMPAGLNYIGKDAFAYDDKLTELTIPSKIKEIGEYAFFNCTAMEKLTVEAKEEDLVLGKKWQPTGKGKILDTCEVIFTK
jgi:hypothetical protein